MQKLTMHTPDLTQDNIARIRALFPHCVTEAKGAKGEDGKLTLAVDFDLLRQELSASIVEGPQERYRLDWPGKREAMLTANAPIAKTLRPCVEESVDFEHTKNLYIEGDNLDALKLLQETYLGKVKMIYIDPPYNTGNDFIYEDDFAENTDEFLRRSNQKDENGNRLVANTESNGRFHSDWLSMMYPRLKLARNLLRDDGVIAVNIDEHETVNLIKLLDEVLGEKNNLGVVVWDKRNPKGDAQGIAYQHEYIVFYAKSRYNLTDKNKIKRPKKNVKAILNKAKDIFNKISLLYTLEDANTDFSAWINCQNDFSGGEKAYSRIDENGDVFQSVSMSWPNKKKAPDDYFIPLVHPVSKKHCPIPMRGWRNPPATMKELLDKGQILFGVDETTQPRRKYLLKDNMDENVPSLLYYGGSDTDLLFSMGIPFDTPKAIDVCKEHIHAFASPNNFDIILDFFSGSATTAHAVMQLNAEDGGNRQFIMVQLPELCDETSEAHKAGYANICEIGKERMRRAGKKILEVQQAATQQSNLLASQNKAPLDIGFRVLKIDSSNMANVYYTPNALNQSMLDAMTDNIKLGRTPEDLLFQVLLDWGVDLTLPIRKQTIQGKTVFFVGENVPPYDIVACFDTGITEELVKELATHKPLRVVFRDNGFASDAVKINVTQIFKQMSPGTEVKIL